MNQATDILRKTMTKKHFAVYEILNDWMAVAQVSQQLNINIGETYGILQRLIKKGLVETKIGGFKTVNGKNWKTTNLYKRA